MALPEILNKDVLANTGAFTVESLDLRFSNGVERKYQRLPKIGNEAVIIVAVSDDAEIMLVREYCAGFHEVRLSLPKGSCETGEPLMGRRVGSCRKRLVFGEIGAICQRVESGPESHGLYNQRDVCKRSLSQTVKGDSRATGIGALAASGFRWFDFRRELRREHCPLALCKPLFMVNEGDFEESDLVDSKIVLDACQATLEIYETEFSVEHKKDESPLTKADLASHEIIVEGLSRLFPEIPILSEESIVPEFERSTWSGIG